MSELFSLECFTNDAYLLVHGRGPHEWGSHQEAPPYVIMDHMLHGTGWSFLCFERNFTFLKSPATWVIFEDSLKKWELKKHSHSYMTLLIMLMLLRYIFFIWKSGGLVILENLRFYRCAQWEVLDSTHDGYSTTFFLDCHFCCILTFNKYWCREYYLSKKSLLDLWNFSRNVGNSFSP